MRAGPRRRSGSRSPAGRTRGATTAASSSSTCATRPGSASSSSTPSALRGGRGRARRPERVRPPRRGRGRRRAPRGRQPEPPDRRGRAPGRPARDPLALPAAAVPARRGGRRRDAPPPLPLARPAPRRSCSATSGCARRWSAIIRRAHGGGRLRRHRDADPGQADARGRPRLPRPEPAPAGPLLRAAAVAADLQAAARHLRLRALLPDRPLLPGRGSARRPAPGAHASSTSRWRSPTGSSSST